MGVAARWDDLKRRLDAACGRAGRDPATVRLLGACKRQHLERIRRAHQAGLRLLGENRLQEGLDHQRELEDLEDLEWHYIGAIQSRKCRDIALHFDAAQTVDRVKVARRLDEAASEAGRILPILLEVNVGAEASKAGCRPEEARALLEDCLGREALDVRGLMSLPPHTEDPEDSRPFHRMLRELRDRLQEETGARLPELSMGMSHDFEVAVEEGSTLVRVGTALFGARGETGP